MTQRFTKRFETLRAKNEGAFVPFVTLCDPDKETSVQILATLIESGADALELGFPFSDPCADGPAIQNADKRALSNHTSTSDMFEVVARIRAISPDTPLSCLVYSNVVYARGIEKFFRDAAQSGLDAVLIPDIPVEMIHTCGDFEKQAEKAGVGLVLIAPPNAKKGRLAQIAAHTHGYTYVVSRYGTTGTETTSGHQGNILHELSALKAPPSLLGFGISKPEHVSQALEDGASGAIAGSACVKIIAEHLNDKTAMLEALGRYVQEMKAATRK